MGAGVHTVRRMHNSKGAPTPLDKPRHLVWLTIADVLADLDIDRGTLDKWRKRGVGPRMKQLPNRTWRIRGDWYDAWLANLSAGALVAVLAAGLVVVGAGLARRAGSAGPVRRPPAGALVLLGAAATFEAVALASPAVPTLSDLADRPLAAPVVRAAAVVVWLALDAWLVARPTGALAAAMRRPVGRTAVLAGWLWVGVHVLAR